MRKGEENGGRKETGSRIGNGKSKVRSNTKKECHRKPKKEEKKSYGPAETTKTSGN